MARLAILAAILASSIVVTLAQLSSSDQGMVTDQDQQYPSTTYTPIRTTSWNAAATTYGGVYPQSENDDDNHDEDELYEVKKYVAIKCPKQLTSCKSVTYKNKKYEIATMMDGIEMMCDMETDKGGWTVIMRGDTDFQNKTWGDYKYGFGDYKEDFWFGLEKLHQLTYKGRYYLRIDMRYNEIDYYAKYNHFRVWGEKEYYKLEAKGYSGNASDEMKIHNNMYFTTSDQDNDKSFGDNCASLYKGGWWYEKCHSTNPTGIWNSKEYGEGMNWHGLTGYTDHVTWMELKIKRY